jgi:hypothetical protein
MMAQLQIPKSIKRFPRLDTILMVEKFIQDNDGEYTRVEMWRNLPKKMMYQSFRVVIHYLLYSRKISIDSEGKVGWIPFTTRKIRSNMFWRDSAALNKVRNMSWDEVTKPLKEAAKKAGWKEEDVVDLVHRARKWSSTRK